MKKIKYDNDILQPVREYLGNTVSLFLFALISIGSTSCSQNNTDNAVVGGDQAKSKKSQTASNHTTKKNGKVKFKAAVGTASFSLKFYEDGLKMLDENEAEITRITRTKEGKYKIKDANDRVLGYVTGNTPKFKIKDSSQQSTLFIFQRQQDGDWKLETEDVGEQLLCKIGKRDYGWKIESASEKELGKVKNENGRISIRGANGNTLFYTNDSFSGIAVVPFTLQQLTKPQQAALCAALNSESN